MNPLTNIKSRQRQREQEVLSGVPESASYHRDFRSSAYVYAGQLSFRLTEGDLLAAFSEYGEVVDVNLVRDKKTGASRGFAYLAYEDQRSTDLAVDNLNGFSLAGRIIAVDHVRDYKRLVENPDAIHADGDPSASEAAPSDTPQAAGSPPATVGDARRAEGAAQDGQGAPGPAGGAEEPLSVADMLRAAEEELGGWRARLQRERAAPAAQAR